MEAVDFTCPSCSKVVDEADVRCGHCGRTLASTGAQRVVGQVLLGHYRVEEILGQGGMSVVYLARHEVTGQAVAMKVMPPDLASQSNVRARFLEEAKALAKLDHPNIVHLYNYGTDNGALVLAMQYVPGITWARLIGERKKLPWARVVQIALDTLAALHYAHERGIVHRDIKPSNVLIREDGRATVMDFGIAKMTTSARLTGTGQTMGTVRYMSPEQVRGLDVTPSTDLYSLGLAIYESIVGDVPFDAPTQFEIMTKHVSQAPVPPSRRGAELPPALDAAIMKVLAKRPAERFASAAEFGQELESILANDAPESLYRSAVRTVPPGETSASSVSLRAATPVRASTPSVQAPTKANRSRALAWSLALTVLLAGLAAAFYVWLDHRHAGAPATNVSNKPRYAPSGVTRTGSMEADGIIIETFGTVEASAIATQVTNVWQSIQQKAGRTEHAPNVQGLRIVAIGAPNLCDARIYESPAAFHPSQCTSLWAYYRVGDDTLVVADGGPWQSAVATGLSDAVDIACEQDCEAACTSDECVGLCPSRCAAFRAALRGGSN